MEKVNKYSPPMKVSIIVGGRFHAFDLAKRLHQAGILHRLITTYPKFKTRQWDIPDNLVISLPLPLLIEKFLYRMGKEILVRRAQAWIHQLFAQAAARHLEGSTLIHGWSSVSEPALHWAKKNRVPFILERSSAHMAVQYQLLTDEYQKLGLQWVATHPEVVAQELREYTMADRVAVPSLFVKNSFITQGFPETNLVHNPFGTDVNNFFPGSKSDNIFRVVYAGSLSVRKGIGYLVQGFMKANLPESELLLIGGKTTETSLLLSGADQQVKCIGHVPQTTLVGYYHNSSVFVMPSIEEGLAMVQAQALACGLPLICTTNTGGEDLLQMSGEHPIEHHGKIQEYPAGYLVPVHDSQAIAECLAKLSQNPSLLKAKQDAALSLRSSSLSWDTYAERAITAYHFLIENAKQPIDTVEIL